MRLQAAERSRLPSAEPAVRPPGADKEPRLAGQYIGPDSPTPGAAAAEPATEYDRHSELSA